MLLRAAFQKLGQSKTQCIISAYFPKFSNWGPWTKFKAFDLCSLGSQLTNIYWAFIKDFQVINW